MGRRIWLMCAAVCLGILVNVSIAGAVTGGSAPAAPSSSPGTPLALGTSTTTEDLPNNVNLATEDPAVVAAAESLHSQGNEAGLATASPAVKALLQTPVKLVTTEVVIPSDSAAGGPALAQGSGSFWIPLGCCRTVSISQERTNVFGDTLTYSKVTLSNVDPIGWVYWPQGYFLAYAPNPSWYQMTGWGWAFFGWNETWGYVYSGITQGYLNAGTATFESPLWQIAHDVDRIVAYGDGYVPWTTSTY